VEYLDRHEQRRKIRQSDRSMVVVVGNGTALEQVTTRVSVCMATHNGARHIAAQLTSIVGQLETNDEIIVVDDQSTDGTLDEIRRAAIANLTIIVPDNHLGVARAFELAISLARGRFIFLSDQDDVWLPGRVSTMMANLSVADLVVSDAIIVDENLRTIHPSYFGLKQSRAGVLNNLYKNHYVGCCMAFKAEVATTSLPFPKGIHMHDVWIGLVANTLFRVAFLDEQLLLYRRHAGTQTFVSSAKKPLSITIISRRVFLTAHLISRVASHYLRRGRRNGSSRP